MKPRLTGKMRKALPLLASGLSGVATAKAVGVKPSTVSEWLNHCPDFIESLEELREAEVRQAMAQLQGNLSQAVEEVRRIMTTSKTDAVRLRAAQFVIEAYGIPKHHKESNNDLVSHSELAVVSEILKGLGGSRATV